MFFKFGGSKQDAEGAINRANPPAGAFVAAVSKTLETGGLKVEKANNAGETARALGTYHEELRNRCETATTSLQSLRTAADEVQYLFDEFGNIAKQLYDHRKELGEARALAQSDRSMIEELRGKLSNTQSLLVKLQAQHEETTAERDNLLRTRLELGEAYQSAQVALKESDSRVKVLEMECSAAQNQLGELSVRFDALTRNHADKEKELHELRAERKIIQANLDFEMAEKHRFTRLHDEVVSTMGSQRRALNSAGEELEKSRERILHLESRYSEMIGEKETLISTLETAKALRESDAKNFEVKLEAVNSRARLAEHLLEKARGEQRSFYADQTAQTEMQRQIRNLEGMIETQKQDLQEATRRNRDLENSDNVRKAKVEDLQMQIRGQQRSTEQAGDKIKSLQELLEAVQVRHNAQNEQHEEQLRQLNEQIERERSDRVYLEGALNTARRERNLLQGQLIKMKTGQQDASSIIVFDTDDGTADEETTDYTAINNKTVTELRPGHKTTAAKVTDKSI